MHAKLCTRQLCNLQFSEKVRTSRFVLATDQHSPRNQYCPMKFHVSPGSSFRNTYSNRKGGRYAVIADHYSHWFEVGLFYQNITATSLFLVAKTHFAHYGVPDMFLSDFSKAYDFTLVTKSLYYVKATGKLRRIRCQGN